MSTNSSEPVDFPVIGFMNGSGKTATVKELAFHLGSRSSQVCVIDADFMSPSLTLELVGRSSINLLDLTRQFQGQAQFSGHTSTQYIDAEYCRLIPGLVSPRRWPDVSISAFQELSDSVSRDCSHVLYDLCTGLEPILMSRSTMEDVPRLRDPRQLAGWLIQSSGVAVVTTKPDDISLTRLVDGLTMRQKQLSEIQLHIVVTQVLNSREEKTCRKTLYKLLGIHDISFIQHDLELARESIVARRPASQIKPNSYLAQSYAELADKLVREKQNTLATTRMTSVLRRVS